MFYINKQTNSNPKPWLTPERELKNCIYPFTIKNCYLKILSAKCNPHKHSLNQDNDIIFSSRHYLICLSSSFPCRDYWEVPLCRLWGHLVKAKPHTRTHTHTHGLHAAFNHSYQISHTQRRKTDAERQTDVSRYHSRNSSYTSDTDARPPDLQKLPSRHHLLSVCLTLTGTDPPAHQLPQHIVTLSHAASFWHSLHQRLDPSLPLCVCVFVKTGAWWVDLSLKPRPQVIGWRRAGGGATHMGCVQKAILACCLLHAHYILFFRLYEMSVCCHMTSQWLLSSYYLIINM